MDNFVGLVGPYKDSLFTIPINKEFSFCKLNKLYSYEVGYSYAKFCSTYFKCLYLLRQYSLSADDSRILDLQRKNQEKKLQEFNKTFNKKRLRNSRLKIDIE